MEKALREDDGNQTVGQSTKKTKGELRNRLGQWSPTFFRTGTSLYEAEVDIILLLLFASDKLSFIKILCKILV